MTEASSFILYRAYGNPAVYLSDGVRERCLVMRSASGRFAEDDETLGELLSSSPDIRRVSQPEFERLCAQTLARAGKGPSHLQAELSELLHLEHESLRSRTPLGPAERARISDIARRTFEACVADPAYGLPEDVIFCRPSLD